MWRTSSFLWLNILWPVADRGWRCLALDLIGMGRSGKPDLGYRLADHARYLDAFLDALELPPAVLVGHDWGAVLAVDLLGRRPGRVTGPAVMEGHPHPVDGWLDLGGGDLFEAMRRPGEGERMGPGRVSAPGRRCALHVGILLSVDDPGRVRSPPAIAGGGCRGGSPGGRVRAAVPPSRWPPTRRPGPRPARAA